MSRGIAIARIAADRNPRSRPSPPTTAMADGHVEAAARRPVGGERVGGREQGEVGRLSGGTGSPKPPARPPSTNVPAPAKATNAKQRRDQHAPTVGRQGPIRGHDPLLEGGRPIDSAVAPSAAKPGRSARGRSRRARLDHPATAGRISDSIRTPRSASSASTWPSTWSAPTKRRRQQEPATSHVAGPSEQPSQPDDDNDDQGQVATGGGHLAGD